jgi:putative acetyltransferase
MREYELEVLQAVGVVIRPIRSDDIKDLHDMALQPKVLDGTLVLPSARLSDTQKRFESLGPDDHQMVAEVNGRAIGKGNLKVMPGKLRHIGAIGLSVHDEYQGQGVGRALMTALLDLADNYLGLVRVELEVFVDNAPAIHLYESLGFVIEGRKRKGTFRRGEYLDTLIMGRVR